jgi:hypothetical protein
VDQRAESVAAGLCRVQNIINVLTIGVAHLGPGRVTREVRDEGASKFFILVCKKRNKVRGAVEGASIAEFSAWIHLRTDFVVHPPRCLALFWRRVAFAVGTIALAQSANRVERLECKARCVDLGVAGRAAWVVTMPVELFPHGGCAARVWVNR